MTQFQAIRWPLEEIAVIRCRIRRGLSDRPPERNGYRQQGNWGLASLSSPGGRPSAIAVDCCSTGREVRRVLIFYSLGPSSPASVLVDREIRAALENSPYQIELYVETLQVILFSDPASRMEVRQGFIRRYGDRKPDVVIAVGTSPIRFMAESHEEFGPNTPVVFWRAPKNN